jgi:hypothetical protein
MIKPRTVPGLGVRLQRNAVQYLAATVFTIVISDWGAPTIANLDCKALSA